MASGHYETGQYQVDRISSDLPAELHKATRTIHLHLNKSITARLSLCLPPHMTTPMAYHLGMLAMGSIYQQFERAMDFVLNEEKSQVPMSKNKTICARHKQIMETVFTDELVRGKYLLQDGKILRQRLDGVAGNETAKRKQAELEASLHQEVTQRTTFVYDNVTSKPYLALAYTWTMYLALFNGGRWILRQLESAGPDFWLEDRSINSDKLILTPISTLSFWHFDAATDDDPHAEQLKKLFKQKFETACDMLTDEEKDAVVKETLALFELCIQLVELLDIKMTELHESPSSQAMPVSFQSTTPTLTRTIPIQSSPAAQQRESRDSSVYRAWYSLGSTILSPAYSVVRRTWAAAIGSGVNVGKD